MNDFLDLIFKLVSSLIGIYVVAHYLTGIDIFDKKKRQLYVNEGIDTDTIAYCLLYVIAIVFTGSFTIYEKWSFSPYFLIPISLFITFISILCFKKNRKSNVFSVASTLFNGAIVGLVLFEIINTFTDEKPDFIAYLILVAINFITSLVFVGRLHINDDLHVLLYIENENLINFFVNKHSDNIDNRKTSNVAYIKAILIDEKEDHYFIEIGESKELYRLPKDQVILIQPKSHS